MLRTTAVCLLAATMLCAHLPNNAQAAGAKAFLEKMQGKWRGRGKVKATPTAKSRRVNCTITGTLNEGTRKLENAGLCATAQGRQRVSGSIGYSADGSKIAGVFFRQSGDVQVTKSRGTVSGNTLLLTSTLVGARAGRLVRTRTTVKLSGSKKFTISVSANEGKGWENLGSISFRK
ncbi:MAG: DUF1579 family protein [Pseudomonadota bacterium]